MRGVVQDYDPAAGAGLIAGDDGERYPFSANDWRGGFGLAKGQRVDFEVIAGGARDVFHEPIGSGSNGRRQARLSSSRGDALRNLSVLWLCLFLAFALLPNHGLISLRQFVYSVIADFDVDGDQVLALASSVDALLVGASLGAMLALRAGVHWALGPSAALAVAAVAVAAMLFHRSALLDMNPGLNLWEVGASILLPVVAGGAFYAVAHGLFGVMARNRFALACLWSGLAGTISASVVGALAGVAISLVFGGVEGVETRFTFEAQPWIEVGAEIIGAALVLGMVALATLHVRRAPPTDAHGSIPV